MTPVEIEFLMRDKLTPGMESAGKSADAFGKKVENVASSIKTRIEDQRKEIKRVEGDIKSLEKEFSKLAPGTAKNEMAAELKAAKKALEEEKAALSDLSNEYEKTNTSSKKLTTELRKMQEELAMMRMQGEKGSDAYEQLRLKAAQLADTLGDVRNETKILSHDDAGLQGMISGLTGIAGGFTVATGLMGVFTKENEDLMRIQTKVQSVMAVTMGLQQVMNALNKDSQFRLHTVAKAKALLTTANTRLAVSLGISNTAAKALMATLTLGLSAAITGVIWAWNKYSDAQEKAAEKRKELLELEKDGRAVMVKTRFELDTTIKSLKDFAGSKEQEKKKVEELNQKYGESFGYYNTISEWYDTLTNKSEAYIKMLMHQANIQRLVNKATEIDEALNEAKDTPASETEGSAGVIIRKLIRIGAAVTGDFSAETAINAYNEEVKENAINALETQREEILQKAKDEHDKMMESLKEINGGRTKKDKNLTNISLDDYELKARRKIEDNTIALMKEGFERQRQEAALAFEREKQRIKDEETQRIELYEKLRAAGEPVTKKQKNDITEQADQQAQQAKDILDKTIADINANEALELEKQDKVIKEALSKYQTYYLARLSTLQKFQKDREALEKGGATDGQFAELDYQQEQALSAIDEQFAMREDSFQKWANSIVNLSLEKLINLLSEAEKELAQVEVENPNDPKLASMRAMVARYKQEIQKQNAKIDTDPGKDSIKRWQNLQKTLSRCSREFNNLGKEVGGTTGEILSSAGEIATSTLTMISSITELANWSMTATKMTAEGVSKAIQAVEKASVILTIISAAIQLIQKLGSLIGDSHDDYLKYAEKVSEINIMRDAVQEYELAVLRAKQAEDSWFSVDGLKSLKQAREAHEEIASAYFNKLTEEQAIYQNKSGAGWTGKISKIGQQIFNAVSGNLLIDKILGSNISKDLVDLVSGGTYSKGNTAAMNNLRIETRKRSKGLLGSGIGGKSQKTEDLVSWARNQGLGELFDSEGLLNKELAETILDKYGNKLVGQTKETLEALVELREQYDEYLNTLHEYVSSLYEPLVDNFVDSLWDWFDEGKNALDSFKGYASQTFRDIVSDMMRTIILKNVVDGFDKDIADLYEDYAENKMTEEELMAAVAKRTEGLIGSYEDNIPQLQSLMARVAEMFKNAGIDLKDIDAESQSGRAGAITTISQDTGNRLEGIGTSMQMHCANIDDGVENINDALGTALGHLRRIEEHTGVSAQALAEIREQIERLIRELV